MKTVWIVLDKTVGVEEIGTVLNQTIGAVIVGVFESEDQIPENLKNPHFFVAKEIVVGKVVNQFIR